MADLDSKLRPIVDVVHDMLERGKSWKMCNYTEALWNAMIEAGEIECTGAEDRKDYWDLAPCPGCLESCPKDVFPTDT